MNTNSDPLGGLRLDANALTRSAIKGIRGLFGITGFFALAIGIALLVWPGATLRVAATLMALYFVVDALMRLYMAITTQLLSTGWRILSILFRVLLLVGGIFMFRNSTVAGEALLITIVFVVGISWIIEGILALTESGFARSQGWAIFLGIISVLAGISVLAVPTWSAVVLMTFTGISLVITGISSLARAFTFGKDVLKTMDARGVDIIDGEIID